MSRILKAGKKEWRKEGRMKGRKKGRRAGRAAERGQKGRKAGQGHLVIKAHFHGLVVPLGHNVQL